MSRNLKFVTEDYEEDGHIVEQHNVEQIEEDFKKIMSQYDENVVNTLMPFMVNILDCMNVGYQQKLKYEAKVERITKENIKFRNKEKNARLVLEQQLAEYIAKYEREREARIFTENRLAEYETTVENDKKRMGQRVESLEISVQTLENKFQISKDCIDKLEEREAYLKKEYSGLLERYTKLFKEHIEYMEKNKVSRHRDLLSDEVLNENPVKQMDQHFLPAEDQNDKEEIANDMDEINELIKNDEESIETVANMRHDEISLPIKEIDETPKVEEEEEEEDEDDGEKNLDIYEELSLTPSIKHISRIPVKQFK